MFNKLNTFEALVILVNITEALTLYRLPVQVHEIGDVDLFDLIFFQKTLVV